MKDGEEEQLIGHLGRGVIKGQEVVYGGPEPEIRRVGSDGARQ